MNRVLKIALTASLFSAALFSSYSPAMAADIRPEVARPLDQARILANGWGDRATITAKLNQAASVPDLNKDEQREIRFITIYALDRGGHGIDPGAPGTGDHGIATPNDSLNNAGPLR